MMRTSPVLLSLPPFPALCFQPANPTHCARSPASRLASGGRARRLPCAPAHPGWAPAPLHSPPVGHRLGGMPGHRLVRETPLGDDRAPPGSGRHACIGVPGHCLVRETTGHCQAAGGTRAASSPALCPSTFHLPRPFPPSTSPPPFPLGPTPVYLNNVGQQLRQHGCVCAGIVLRLSWGEGHPESLAQGALHEERRGEGAGVGRGSVVLRVSRR